MKLVTVKVEYTSGLTLTDRVVVIPTTGEIQFPPRLIALMNDLAKVECSPAVTVSYRGHVLNVERERALEGGFQVEIPTRPEGTAWQRLKKSLSLPTEEQRQQNARYMHTLSASALAGAVVLWHSLSSWDIGNIGNLASLVIIAVILWFVGFRLINGES
jgi:hypothetical protein